MSNLVVDGILFYHGGAADLGTNKEVVKNFGPVSKTDQSFRNRGEADTQHTQRVCKETAQALAKAAKELGANAILYYSNAPTPFWGKRNGREFMVCQVTTSGDAVLIKTKENT